MSGQRICIHCGQPVQDDVLGPTHLNGYYSCFAASRWGLEDEIDFAEVWPPPTSHGAEVIVP